MVLTVGQKIPVYDDGKRYRKTTGEVLAVTPDFIIVSHTLWGYGDQKPLPQLFRKTGEHWYCVHTEYRKSSGEIVELFGYTETSFLKDFE